MSSFFSCLHYCMASFFVPHSNSFIFSSISIGSRKQYLSLKVQLLQNFLYSADPVSSGGGNSFLLKSLLISSHQSFSSFNNSSVTATLNTFKMADSLEIYAITNLSTLYFLFLIQYVIA